MPIEATGHPGRGTTPLVEKYLRRSRLHAGMVGRRTPHIFSALMPAMGRERPILKGPSWIEEAEWQLAHSRPHNPLTWKQLIERMRQSRGSGGGRGWDNSLRMFNEGLCRSLRVGYIAEVGLKRSEELRIAKATMDALEGLALTPQEVTDLAPVWEVLIKQKRGVTSRVVELLRGACHKLTPGSDQHALFVYRMSEVLREYSHRSSIATFLTGLTQRGIQRKYDYRRPLLLAGVVMESFSLASGLSPVNLALPEQLLGLSEDAYQGLAQAVREYSTDKAVQVLVNDLHVQEKTAKALIPKCTFPEAEFLAMVTNYYRESPELIREFWLKVKDRGRMELKIYKRGTDLAGKSSLTLVEVPPYVFFVRKMDWEAGSHWIEAAENGAVAVEPPLQIDEDGEGRLNVLTRYCGPSLRQLIDLSMRLKSSGHDCTELDKLLYVILYRAVKDIQCLATFTDHKHPHPGNITVEFVNKAYYEAHKDDINSPSFYDPAMVHFDVLRYLRTVNDPMAEPEEMVVRFIDFDKAGAPVTVVQKTHNTVVRKLIDALRR